MEAQNPYAAPAATVGGTQDVPQDILKQIRSAWVAACASGAITLLFVVLAFAGKPMAGIGLWQLVDVVLIFGLALGIHRRSRVCAVAMFGYFILSKLYALSLGAQSAGMLMAIIFAYCYWQGVRGTFAWHRLQRGRSGSAA